MDLIVHDVLARTVASLAPLLLVSLLAVLGNRLPSLAFTTILKLFDLSHTCTNNV